jgi:hypothetical protein
MCAFSALKQRLRSIQKASRIEASALAFGVQKKARRVNLQTMTCAIRVACDCICWLSVLASTAGNSLGVHSAREPCRGMRKLPC